ncbi:hypothetical protein Btru_040787 [Bulinus truncatus]|nr:hypothetical protein Btru_040787 [Bulinus truncatus]
MAIVHMSYGQCRPVLWPVSTCLMPSVDLSYDQRPPVLWPVLICLMGSVDQSYCQCRPVLWPVSTCLMTSVHLSYRHCPPVLLPVSICLMSVKGRFNNIVTYFTSGLPGFIVINGLVMNTDKRMFYVESKPSKSK